MNQKLLKNFGNITGKDTCRSFFLNKTPVFESFCNNVAGLTPSKILIKRPRDRCFPVNFAKFLRKTPVVASAETVIDLFIICFTAFVLKSKTKIYIVFYCI